jgi:hypothetical protein
MLTKIDNIGTLGTLNIVLAKKEAMMALSQSERVLVVTDLHMKALVKLLSKILGCMEKTSAEILMSCIGDGAAYGDVETFSNSEPATFKLALDEAKVKAPLVKLTRVLKAMSIITPTLAACKNCGQFALQEAGGVFTVRTEGLCAFCNEALIEVQKVATEHRDWTSGKMVPVSEDENFTAWPGEQVPLTNEGVREFCKDILGEDIHEQAEEMMKAQGLDLVDVLFYLKCEASKHDTRFQQPEACMLSLVRPHEYGFRTPTALEMMLKKAKGFAERMKNVVPAAPDTKVAVPLDASSGSLPSWLCMPSLDWSDKRMFQLCETLYDAYDHPDEIQSWTQRTNRLFGGNISYSGAVSTIIRNVLNFAAKAGLMEQLINKALQDSNISGYHSKIRSILAS